MSNSRSLIYNAITSNDFLNNLEQSQIEEIVLCMYEKRVNKGCFIIREGEPGDALYVTAVVEDGSLIDGGFPFVQL
ncbi:hypothetical protein ACTXT7_002010 [Hymenolepis weldensis]